MSFGIFQMQCETVGSIGNANIGQLIPIDYIEGLTSARLTEILIPGEDDEETEHFRRRYFDSLNAEAFGGNIKDYREKTEALPGVGGVKVHPVWNGGGTVKLIIISSDYNLPSPQLIATVQTAIDPTQNHGLGMGLAPIGHVVTVVGVKTVSVDVELELTYQSGWEWEDTKPYVEKAIDSYFNELKKQWSESEYLVIRISQIETRVLDMPGIIDVANATINGQPHNLALEADEIPIRGNVSE